MKVRKFMGWGVWGGGGGGESGRISGWGRAGV